MFGCSYCSSDAVAEKQYELSVDESAGAFKTEVPAVATEDALRRETESTQAQSNAAASSEETSHSQNVNVAEEPVEPTEHGYAKVAEAESADTDPSTTAPPEGDMKGRPLAGVISIRSTLQSSFLRETLQMALTDPCSHDASQAKSKGWRDISKTGSNVFFKAITKPARDCVCMVIASKDQVPKMPLLTIQNGKIIDGVMPTIWAVEHWKLWFPFCESTEILKRFSPECFIVKVCLKVMLFSVDFIAFISIEDKLSTDNYIDVIVRSPPVGSEGQEWMGITVPPRVGIFPRVCLNFSHMKVKPETMESMNVDAQAEIVDVGGIPQWVKVFFFQQLSIRLIPELVKFQKQIPGSALDKFLNGTGEGCVDAEGLVFIKRLYKSISDFVGHSTS